MAQVVTSRTQLGAQLTTVVDTEQTLSVDLDLRTRYGAQIEILVNSDQSSPTDEIICRMRLSMDDTVYSTLPWRDFTIGLPLNTNNFSYLFNLQRGLWYVRFGFLAAGSTDTYTVDVFAGQITGV